MNNSMLISRNNADMLHIKESCYICIRNFSTQQKHITMKKKITALLAGIFALVITTYAQAPVVTFTATPAAVCAGGTVTFTNTATNFPTSWTWYFPGSNTPGPVAGVPPSGNPATPITYSYPGSYKVTCVATNGSGSDSVTTQNCVVVLPLPRATVDPPYGGICDIGAGPTALDTIYFSMTDTTAGNTYSWAPNNTNSPVLSCTNCENPKGFPAVNTVYTITVTGADGCSITLYDTVTTGSITAHITGKTSLCAGSPDTLVGSGGSSNPPGTTYIWSNGVTTSDDVVYPTTTTTYSLNIISGTGGCTSNTATITVNVSPVPAFTVTSPDSICFPVPGSAVITVAPPTGNPYQYYWFGPNAAPDTTDIYTVYPPVTTNYTLVVQNNFCFYDTLVHIKVNNPPVVHFTGATDLCQGSSTTICATGGDQYTWSTGESTSCINVTPPASLTYTVQVRSGECYKDTAYTIIVDTMPNNVFLGDTSICKGDSTTIYASSKKGLLDPGYEYTYMWNTGATVDSIVTGPINNSETFYLTVTKGACSKDSAAITVKVYPHPNPNVKPFTSTICQWDSVQLTATGGEIFHWSQAAPSGPLEGLPDTLFYSNTDTNKVKASPPVTTIYYVNVCTWGCCKRDSVTVSVTPGVLGFNVCCDTTVSSGTPVNLSATFDPGPYQVSFWTPTSGLSCSSCPNPTATVDSTTKYVVTFLDLITGCTVKDSVTIDIFNCNVFVPNAFSPNGDGVNDYLYVRSLCMKSMDFAVFDRLGNKIFETTDQNIPWDGTYHGRKMDVGTYMWYLTGLLSDGTHISKSGNVTLVR